jgi:uncharacterized RDD family membrane protein YckC
MAPTVEIPVLELPGRPGGVPPREKSAELTIDIEEAPGQRQREIRASIAPLWRRVLAWIVDGASIAGVVAIYLWAASAIIGFREVPSQVSGIDRIVARAQVLQPILIPGLVLALVVALAYSAAFAVLLDGRTFGRLMAGIRLVDRSGLPPSPTRAVVRALLSIVSFGLFLGGFWLALFDARGQTLHDKLTSTFVVRPA